MNGDGGKNFFNRGSFKIGLTHWLGTAIVAIVAGFVIFGLLRGQEFLASFLADRETNKAIKELERPYREDKYGGKTPEETFDLFLGALRKGDIELASKYFVIDKQEGWRNTLQELKNDKEMGDFISSLENYKKIWVVSKKTNTEIVYTYELEEGAQTTTLPNGQKVSFPAGKYKYDIVLEKNPFSGVWKLVRI